MKYIVLFLILAMTYACNDRCGKEEKKHQISVNGDTIIIKNHSSLTEKLKSEITKSEPYHIEFRTSGVVKAIPTHYAQIASPFAGRITKSFVRLGQKMMPGSPVFEISSPSFFETGKAYYQTKQEMQLAQKSLQREKDLLSHGVGVQKEMEEAEVNYELKRRDYENALAALRVFQIEPEQLVLGQPLIVRSPIAGEIVENNIVLGQYLKEDAEPVAIIADLGDVWVVGQVKEKDINLIKNLEKVEVRLAAMPDTPIKGSIYHISEMLDEETRSVEVLIACNNQERMMKPGMYVTVKYADTATEVVRIPTSSILQHDDNSYLFIDLGDHHYLKKKVTTTGSDDGRTVVLDGIHPGDKVVTEGAFYLLDIR